MYDNKNIVVVYVYKDFIKIYNVCVVLVFCNENVEYVVVVFGFSF